MGRHPDCEMQMLADPAPNGPIGLVPVGGEYAGWWLFTYVPCADGSCVADKFPFMVTLSGRDGDEILNQSFELTPWRISCRNRWSSIRPTIRGPA
jgi:hypothetical protein